MPSDKSAPREVLNERLAELRDKELLEAEEVIAQVQADQSQAVVLTKSRVLLLKVGLTATGTLDGHVATACRLDKIKTVDVRKGPMGAVLHIVTDEAGPSAPGLARNDVVVFNDLKKTTACETIAAKIRKAADHPSSSEPVSPEPEKRGVSRQSLAEQIYAETVSSPPVHLENTDSADTQESSQEVCEVVHILQEPGSEIQEPDEPEEQEEPQAIQEFRPNPNLPKPLKKNPGARHKIAAVAAALAVVAVAGVAVVSFQQTAPVPRVKINVAELTKNMRVIGSEYVQVFTYHTQVHKILQPLIQSSPAIRNAIVSGNSGAVSSALRQDNSAWRELNNLQVPPGLAGAQENLISGMFTRMNTLTESLSSPQHSPSADPRSVLDKLDHSDASIQKGLNQVDSMMQKLDAQVAAFKSRK